MSVEWFTKRPGCEIAQGSDDPTMLIVGVGLPDWVRLPPELGGARVRVLRGFMAPCPMCEGYSAAKHMVLPDDIGVAECENHGFVWYRRRVKTWLVHARGCENQPIQEEVEACLPEEAVAKFVADIDETVVVDDVEELEAV